MSTVRVETTGPIAVITIDRPEVANAIDGPTSSALADAFRDFETDSYLLVAVLTGAGGTFCSGADMVAGDRGAKASVAGDSPAGPTRLVMTKPVIAAVEGHAVAGGLSLALWCDIRVAARDAVFGVFNRRWGIPEMDGATVRLPRIVGQGHALDMILSGRGVSGDEAQAMGLANRLVEPGRALDHALELAKTISQFPQHALRADRLSAVEQWDLTLDAGLLNEFRRGWQAQQAGDQRIDKFLAGKGRHGAFD
jgi:enoyl-CoA hydratase